MYAPEYGTSPQPDIQQALQLLAQQSASPVTAPAAIQQQTSVPGAGAVSMNDTAGSPLSSVGQGSFAEDDIVTDPGAQDMNAVGILSKAGFVRWVETREMIKKAVSDLPLPQRREVVGRLIGLQTKHAIFENGMEGIGEGLKGIWGRLPENARTAAIGSLVGGGAGALHGLVRGEGNIGRDALLGASLGGLGGAAYPTVRKKLFPIPGENLPEPFSNPEWPTPAESAVQPARGGSDLMAGRQLFKRAFTMLKKADRRRLVGLAVVGFAEKRAAEKRGLHGVLGAGIGGLAGGVTAPSGHRTEGIGRGVLRGGATGIGADVGMLGGALGGLGIGAAGGAGLGAGAGVLLKLLARNGMIPGDGELQTNPDFNAAGAGALAGAALGGAGGAGIGAVGGGLWGGRKGYDMAGDAIGPASYDKPEHAEKKDKPKDK